MPRVTAMVVARLSPMPSQWHAAEEIVQATMLALTTGLPRLENRCVAGLKSFASTIVTHKVADFLRGRGDGGSSKEVTISLDSVQLSGSATGALWQFLSASQISPRSALARAEQVKIAVYELGRLRRQYREVITLAFLDELPLGEVADLLGLSKPATSMLLVRAVRALRRRLTGNDGSEKQAIDISPRQPE
ncbi:MAG: sigma-70 family RNA polymerase sigma factor [bacterium]|nr:sigma-70 family RNA polymerase sigma factor [bacterium]